MYVAYCYTSSVYLYVLHVAIYLAFLILLYTPPYSILLLSVPTTAGTFQKNRLEPTLKSDVSVNQHTSAYVSIRQHTSEKIAFSQRSRATCSSSRG